MIYIIDHQDSFTWNIVHQFAEFEKVYCSDYFNLNLKLLKKSDVIVFSPGPGSPKDYPETSKIYKIFKGKKKIIGICLGFQLILFNEGGIIKQQNNIYHGYQSKVKVNKKKSIFKKISEVLLTMASKPSGFIGLSILVFHILLAFLSPFLAPYDFKAIDPSLMLQAPSSEYWFGTDSLGRDVFTRTIMGGRTALTITFFGSLIALLWGGLLGIFCGLVGGKIDDVVMRVVDAFLSIPWILAMLLIVSLLGTSTQVLIPALGFFYGKGIVRVARAATHDVIAKDFIVSARARGHSNLSIIWNEIIPNVRDAILVEGAMRWSWMLLGFSSLSFLGFGVSPPTPDWGLMISNARGLMSFAYWAVIAPIVGLSSLIIGINLTADAFAKALGIDRSTKAPV